MKIRKKEFKTKETLADDILAHVQKVLYPFEESISKRSIRVLSHQSYDKGLKACSDWVMFEFILFNLIQNAVKYNVVRGYIVLLLDIDLEPGKEAENEDDKFCKARLRVRIIDTGLGIEAERQAYLFRPFLELQHQQSIQMVKDHSIGLGLACSSDIVSQFKGKIQLVKSEKNFTLFEFEMGIKVLQESIPPFNISQMESEKGCGRELGNIDQPKLKDYLVEERISSLEPFAINEVDAHELNDDSLLWEPGDSSYAAVKKSYCYS